MQQAGQGVVRGAKSRMLRMREPVASARPTALDRGPFARAAHGHGLKHDPVYLLYRPQMHSDMNGLYAILNLDPTASEQAIRIAFRRLAKELHPDVRPDRAPEFIQLKRAYDILSNPLTRIEYDRACVGGGGARTSPSPLPARPYPPSLPRARRGMGTISNYLVAFTLMTVVATLLMGTLFILYGSAPPFAPSIEEADFGKSGSTPAKDANREQDSGTTDIGPRSDTRSGSSARKNQDKAPTGARRRTSWWDD